MTSNQQTPFPRLASATIIFLLLLLALCVFGSWMAAAMGLRVDSMLSGEALRWFFRQSLQTVGSWRGEILILLAIALGALRESGLTSSPGRHPHAWLASLLVLGMSLGLLAMGFFSEDAPLLSVSGRILPSPFLPGFAWTLTSAIVLACAVYGFVSRRFRSWQEGVSLCYVGIQHYAPWLIVWGLAEILYKTFRYVL